MGNDWAGEFYKMQYESFNYDDESFNIKAAAEILEQTGRPFSSLLELGAWDGGLARALAHYADRITTVELVKEMVEAARKLNPDTIDAVHGSFYDVALEDKFNVIIYVDGFGVGTDEDQLQLLRNIHGWLDDDGCALIDVYQPEHWKKAGGAEMYPDPANNPDIVRRYSYDFDENIMMDTWWHKDDAEPAQTQYLKCYTTEEIHRLCGKAGLRITAYFPNGAMDYKNMKYYDDASLHECMSYRIKVKK